MYIKTKINFNPNIPITLDPDHYPRRLLQTPERNRSRTLSNGRTLEHGRRSACLSRRRRRYLDRTVAGRDFVSPRLLQCRTAAQSTGSQVSSIPSINTLKQFQFHSDCFFDSNLD